ncbi:hypothetical protein AgCh_030748 [Apium graveolens]
MKTKEELKKEKPYDFLAFIPIIEGAGGVITDWAGQKLQWEASPMSIGPTYYRIIAAGDDQDALEYLKDVPSITELCLNSININAFVK